MLDPGRWIGPSGLRVQLRGASRTTGGGMTKSFVLSHRTMAPGIPSRVVTRPRLNSLYSELYGRRRHVVVIAPAGAGKTVQAQLFAHHADLPLAWLSLRATDVSPSRLLNSLAAALGRFAPAAHDELRAALRSDFTVEETASILAGAIGPDRFLLVVDQCEEVAKSAEATAAMSTFAEYCPPTMRLMSLTRTELPDVVKQGVFEDTIGIVTESDLRLTTDEATELVIAHGGDERRAAALVQETSGWMAGVVFGSHQRSPGRSSMDLTGYIRAEVLGQLPEDEQQFLLDSSVLDAVNGDTAEAILGRPGRELCERIRARHLPAVTMTECTMVYHSVLKTVLRTELVARDADREGLLLRRYAEYLVAHHHEEEAVELFLDLHDLDRAAENARAALPALWERADWGVLARWLDSLGDERIDHDPLFVAARIRTLYGTRRFDSAIELIRRLDQRGELRAATETDPGLVATMGWALQADPSESRRLLDRYPGDYRAEAVRFMLDTHTGLAPAVPPRMSGWGEFERLVTWALILQGRLAEAARMIPTSPEGPVVNPNVVLVPLWRGDTAAGRTLWERVPDEIRERPHSLFIESCLLLAEGDRESAVGALQAAVAESRKTGFPLDPVYEVMCAFVLMVRGDDDDAVTILEQHLGELAEFGRLALTEWAQAFLGIGYLRTGSTKRARLILQECVRSMQQAKRRLLLPLASSALAEAEAIEGDLSAAHDYALLAVHTASLTEGTYWLDWGARLFPEVRRRELDGDDADERWQHVGGGAVASRAEPVAEDAAPIEIYLQSFGSSPDIYVNGNPKQLGRLKMLELVGYLSLHPGGIDRNVLQQQLFPKSDQRRGGNHFRQITHKLRAATGISLARFGGTKVTWPPNVTVDTADLEFERLLGSGGAEAGEDRIDTLRRAVAMSGTYLERSDLPWADERRYQLDVLREEALLELADLCFDHGEPAEARTHCEALLELDPYNESSYVLLLRVEQCLGTPTSRLAVYRRAVKALQELGLAPSEEMAALVGPGTDS